MDAKQERNLIFRIIEYGLRKDVLSLNSLKEDLKLDESTFQFAFNHLFTTSARQFANHLIASVQSVPIMQHVPQYTYHSLEARLLPSAVFQYIDYLEIKAARKAARESKKLAWIAI